MAMIEVEAVSKHFGPNSVLSGVQLATAEGETMALLGPNGAGKTTLLRILTTLLEPDGGHARVAGFDTVADAARLRSVIAFAGQFAAVDELLSGRENLELMARLYHLGKVERQRRVRAVLEGLLPAATGDRLVKTYSGGMRRCLDIAATFIGTPRVLFLDEPTTGLDPRARRYVWRLVEDLAASGTTVLLTTQSMEEAEHLADRIVVLNAGLVVAQGTPGELKGSLGDDILEVHATVDDVDRAAVVIGGLANRQPTVDYADGRVSVPAENCVGLLIATARRLQEEGVAVRDLGIRRASLDDVFLSVTREDPSQHDDVGISTVGLPRLQATSTSNAIEPAQRSSGATTTALRDTWGLTIRNLLRLVRTPQLMVFSALQPAMLLILFRYVLGGAIRAPGNSYVDYITPAVFVEAVVFGGLATAIGLASDVRSGIIDRFRTLPIARSAVLSARMLADAVRVTCSLALMIGLGLLVGFRFHSSAGTITAGLLLVIVFGFCVSWLFSTIGLLASDPETAQVVSMLPIFVLVFVSSALVPVNTMPGWLQPFALHQPVTITIDAARNLFQGEATHGWVWQSLAWSAGILVLFSATAVRLYRGASL
jgi:ABC transporter DrrB family efflux protein